MIANLVSLHQLFSFVEMQSPTFITAPSNPTSVVEGDSITLEWRYNLSGVFRAVEFRHPDVPFIADKFRSDPIRIRTEYQGRITVNVTDTFTSITFLSVNRGDSRTYRFVVQNQNQDDPAALNQIILEVKCKWELL